MWLCALVRLAEYPRLTAAVSSFDKITTANEFFSKDFFVALVNHFLRTVRRDGVIIFV